MITRMMVCAFLLGLFVGCEPATPRHRDTFLLLNDDVAHIIAVHRGNSSFNFITVLEGAKTKDRAIATGDFRNVQPAVGDLVYLRPPDGSNSKVYRIQSVVEKANK